MTEELTFSYTNDAETARVVRTWEKLGPNDLRRTDTEHYRNHETGEWEESYSHTRDYQIDDQGRLVNPSDDYWGAEGKLWWEYAEERHHTLLEARFPRDFGKAPVTDGTNERILKDLAAKNA